MAYKKRSGFKKLIVIAVVIAVVLIGVFVYYYFVKTPRLDERAAVEAGVQSAKKSTNLTPEQEQLLRVQLSIVDYIAKKEIPPNSLADLIPAYFDAVPRNAKTKKTFFYRRKGTKYTLRLSEEEQVQVASRVADKKKGETGRDTGLQKGEGVSAVSTEAPVKEDFVNPNTMVEEDYVYDPKGKRDPFVPFDLSPKVLREGPLTPLERYTIGQLRLTAVLDDAEGTMTAIVEDAAGKGYTVRPGTKIGDSGGVVVSIERDRLKVLETRVDFAGNEKQHVVEMKLYQKDNE